MSQLTAAAKRSRIQSLRNASTAGGGGGDRCRCCGGGGGVVLMVSTHAATSECPMPSAAYRRISTSRRLRDGRATTRLARRGLARLGWRAWARCGVANAMAALHRSFRTPLVAAFAALSMSVPAFQAGQCTTGWLDPRGTKYNGGVSRLFCMVRVSSAGGGRQCAFWPPPRATSRGHAEP